MEILNYVFAAVFNIECILKLVAMSWRYFTFSWNRFDFFVVVGTNFGILFKFIDIGVDISTTITVIRSFRILRLLKQLGKVIINTLINIIPSITNIIALIFLLFFIFSALGIQLFATVKLGDGDSAEYNENYNFRSFFKSLLLLM